MLTPLPPSRTFQNCPMPLYYHRRHYHHDSVLPYHRPDDETKPHHPYAPSTFPSSPISSAFAHRLLLFAIAYLLTVDSLAFAVTSYHHPLLLQPTPASIAFRCGHTEDSLRSFLTSSRNYSVGDREKVLALVSVHTELRSVTRQSTLRATWSRPTPKAS